MSSPLINSSNSDRFLTAFNEIEKYLTRIYREEEERGFRNMINLSRERGQLSKQQYEDLKQYGKLRNIIVHEFRNNEVIAEPNNTIVKRIEQIRAELKNPRKASELFSKEVVTVQLENTLEKVLGLFWELKISQIPVLSRKKVIDVLNTNTITWWMAVNGRSDLNQVTVSDVLGFTEYKKNYRIVSEKTRLPRVVQIFKESYSEVNQGWFLDAVLITKTGADTSPIVGIIVLEDLVDYLI